jgi:hypothetical protein
MPAVEELVEAGIAAPHEPDAAQLRPILQQLVAEPRITPGW